MLLINSAALGVMMAFARIWDGVNDPINVRPQPASGKHGIVFMMFLIPPVLALVAYILFSRKYRLHSAYLDEVSEAVRRDASIMEAESQKKTCEA